MLKGLLQDVITSIQQFLFYKSMHIMPIYLAITPNILVVYLLYLITPSHDNQLRYVIVQVMKIRWLVYLFVYRLNNSASCVTVWWVLIAVHLHRQTEQLVPRSTYRGKLTLIVIFE